MGTIFAVGGAAATFFTRAAAIADGAGDSAKILFALCLIAAITGITVFAASFRKETRKTNVHVLALASMMTALCYVGFAFFKIDIPVGTEKTAFHLGNVFCVLAALLLDGLWGGFAGAIGMTLGDLFTGYVTSAPKTFFLKLCIGLITGLVAHHILHLRDEKEPKNMLWKTTAATIGGMLLNVVADPVVGYFYKRYLFGVPQEWAKALAKIGAMTTFVNAVVAVVVATLFYVALKPVLQKGGLLPKMGKQNHEE